MEQRPSLKINRILHGGDYNPDQWLHAPDVLDDDLRLMEVARCNTMSVGIFSWAALEPEEGRFRFDWLDRIMDSFAQRGHHAILATPSAAMPQWLPRRYPEVMRVGVNRVRYLPGRRVSFCLTSPHYRERVRAINEQLAMRYKDHPALLLWHVSNEYGENDNNGACHCNLCQDAFRAWLRHKFDNDIDALNRAWWTGFWSHTYMDWSQIESPTPIGEMATHGLNIDWRRFVTDQTIDFFRSEIVPLRAHAPRVPVTTNFMGLFPGLDYYKFAREVDVVSWDNYPRWHGSGSHHTRFDTRVNSYGWHEDGADWKLAADIAFMHDINRCLRGGQPFLMMESTPSVTNWQQVAKLKRPGMHMLSSLQAVAHGGDGVLYFQWRKGRGGAEKFHGAVVDHVGHEHTRVFREVAETGRLLDKLKDVVGATVQPQVGLICDWQNRWAIDDASGPRWELRDYIPTCQAFYRPFWKRGVSVDVIDMDADYASYKLLVAPMLYMLRPGVAERIERFVQHGGIFVCTYLSGIADENDLCFTSGFPGPLRRLLGVWAEELDALYKGEENRIVLTQELAPKTGEEYKASVFCDLIHAETARVLAVYRDDFYAGRPALTVNRFGKGQAFYVASRNDDRFTDDFCEMLLTTSGVKPVLDAALPEGVTVQERRQGPRRFVFLQNYTPNAQQVDLPAGDFTSMISGLPPNGGLALQPWGLDVLSQSTA